jgi:hypothetical protein
MKRKHPSLNNLSPHDSYNKDSLEDDNISNKIEQNNLR